MRNKFVLLGVCALFVFWAAIMGSAQAQNVQITNGPTVENTGSNSAVVAWSTNVSSSTLIKYGTNPNNLDQVAEAPWGSVTHRVTLQNLQPNTTYYMQAFSQQGQGTGTGATSQISQFTTSGGGSAQSSAQGAGNAQITNGPTANVNGTQAVITWTTSAPSSSVVNYGTNPNSLSQTGQAPWGQTNHQVTLNNLNPNTTYYFQVQSGQAQGTGTMSQSNTYTFHTTQ